MTTAPNKHSQSVQRVRRQWQNFDPNEEEKFTYE
ncbi:hypothetical protein M7I_4327 [Glarea lozoyensis 74030]|uniref:Uncharacterized protein n=1 Tax=Glarea lozoyensis (strain ATCC 74030 / MF5533) TaxID=1104152 RepID=H0ENW4_GLAL7|nr:hypothetical protein M7I_4327 [Glarea lozoyensis 74030]